MDNKYALVTGASSGIGREIATLLAERKYNLLLISNEAEKLINLKNELESKVAVKVEVLNIDLARNEAAAKVYKYCEENNFDVEVLVNNAGFYFFSEVAEADLQKAEQKILLHVLTTSLLCTLFGKQMKDKRKGYIMNVSSFSAYKAFPGIAYYGGTKAYIKYFTRSLRTEMKPYGVNVSCLSPGATHTNLYNVSDKNIRLTKKLGVMLTAHRVARTGLKGLFSNKALIIPGLRTRLITCFTFIIPQFLIVALWSRVRDRII